MAKKKVQHHIFGPFEEVEVDEPAAHIEMPDGTSVDDVAPQPVTVVTEVTAVAPVEEWDAATIAYHAENP